MFSTSFTLIAFQMLNRHMQLEASKLDRKDKEHFHYFRKSDWMTLL